MFLFKPSLGFSTVLANEHLADIQHRTLRIYLHPLLPFRSSLYRRLPTRIQYALPIPPLTPPPHPHNTQQHHLQHLLHPSRPTRHLRLQSQLQTSLPHDRRREKTSHCPTFRARRVATQLADNGRLGVDCRAVECGWWVFGVCGRVAVC